MLTKRTHKNVSWVDLECPTEREVRQVMDEYGIHPLVGHELVGPTVRSKVEVYPTFIYLILHFPVLRRESGARPIAEQEVDFIIGKDFLVTSRYEEVTALHQFSKLFEVHSILDKGESESHAGIVFFHLLRTLYESLSGELEFTGDALNAIERNIFKGRERAMVGKISAVGRELLGIRRALAFHKEILESLDTPARRFFGDDFGYHTKAALGEYYKAYNAVEHGRESLLELRETNNSLLDARETETMKRLTVVAFLALPASVLTNFFQMATVDTPIVGLPNDWLIIMLIMFLGTMGLFVAAKMAKWF